MSYDSLGSVQLTFLRLMSREAYQNFTYTCLNSAAWYDTTTASYASAIRLQGDNEEEFSVTNNKPNVIMDGCKVVHMPPRVENLSPAMGRGIDSRNRGWN
jgi:collagen type V/XI/XXIV/XXVII alpha